MISLKQDEVIGNQEFLIDNWKRLSNRKSPLLSETKFNDLNDKIKIILNDIQQNNDSPKNILNRLHDLLSLFPEDSIDLILQNNIIYEVLVRSIDNEVSLDALCLLSDFIKKLNENRLHYLICQTGILINSTTFHFIFSILKQKTRDKEQMLTQTTRFLVEIVSILLKNENSAYDLLNDANIMLQINIIFQECRKYILGKYGSMFFNIDEITNEFQRNAFDISISIINIYKHFLIAHSKRHFTHNDPLITVIIEYLFMASSSMCYQISNESMAALITSSELFHDEFVRCDLKKFHCILFQLTNYTDETTKLLALNVIAHTTSNFEIGRIMEFLKGHDGQLPHIFVCLLNTDFEKYALPIILILTNFIKKSTEVMNYLYSLESMIVQNILASFSTSLTSKIKSAILYLYATLVVSSDKANLDYFIDIGLSLGIFEEMILLLVSINSNDMISMMLQATLIILDNANSEQFNVFIGIITETIMPNELVDMDDISDENQKLAEQLKTIVDKSVSED